MKQICTFAALFLSAVLLYGQQSPEVAAVWKLEHNYWNYVKAADLDSYRNLWHENFVGWPMSSLEPVRKDHITDWITAETKAGRHLQSFTLKEAASHFTEDVVVTHYWITETWSDKDHHEKTTTVRITHTWIRVKDSWQIIGGMSAPVEKL